jgi:metal-sulfur cluster biosynthetic enzyme
MTTSLLDQAPTRNVGEQAATVPLDVVEVETALRQVVDPEMGLNIVDLGLIYDILVNDGDVEVQMTLTSPACPMGPYIIGQAKAAVESIEGVVHGEIILVWEPFWTSDRINPRVRALMGY